MNTKNFLLVLGATALIAIASFIYTAFDNTAKEKQSAIQDSKTNETFEANAEFQSEAEIFSDTNYSNFETTFVHTVPGEYSEIFVTGSGFTPNEKMIVYLKKTGSSDYEPGGHELFSDENGAISTTFKVTSYGSYDVESFYSSKGDLVSTVVVE